jgi:hypothetical protein
MNSKLSFTVPSEYEQLKAYNEIKMIMQNKESLRKLLLELEIINDEIKKCNQLSELKLCEESQFNNEIKLNEYTILKRYALKELNFYKPSYLDY